MLRSQSRARLVTCPASLETSPRPLLPRGKNPFNQLHLPPTNTDSRHSYLDLYSSTDPTNPAYFGNLAVVVHLSNKTRIACANFTAIAPGVSSLPGVPTASSGHHLPTGTGILNNSYTVPAPSGTGTGSPSTTAGQPTFSSAAPTQPTQPTEPLPSSGSHKLMVTGIGALAGFFAFFL
jgi:hypothetical protein